MRSGRAIRPVLGLAGALLVAAAVSAVPAAHAEAVTARATPLTVLTGTGVLNDVVAVTATNVWAVGHYGGLANPKALVEHWNGTAWHRISVSPAAGWLDGVAATSARDIWAVGLSGARALILHFDGTAWRRVASPAAEGSPAVLAGVTVISPRNAWAAGMAGNKSLIEHWNGTAWARVPSPSPQGLSFLTGVSAASADDVSAVGGFNRTLIVHWNGTRWRQVPSPSPGSGAMLNRVKVISARDAWATGSSGLGILVLHWNGTAWQRARSPAAGSGAGLVGIAGTSRRNLWAVGATNGLGAVGARQTGFAAVATTGARPAPSAGAGPAAEPLILHWNGAAWRRISIPLPANGGMLIGVYAASGRNAWAVGSTMTFASINARPLVLHWNGTAWN
jgi:hypothetical protein